MAKSFDQMLQETRKKKHHENLAQQILGSRSRTPTGPRPPALNASIASRCGVAKRTASLPRSNSSPAARAPRPPPAQTRSNRPPPRASDIYREDTNTRAPYSQQQPARDFPAESKSNGRSAVAREPVATSFSVRGAAKSEQPLIVLAENFATGTTAADIEAVMLDVGGDMHSCRLLATDPVVAELTFVDRQGAETVIETFDGKKADGRTLHVYWKGQASNSSRQRSPEAVGFVVDTEPADTMDTSDTMDVDEHTREREEQNRLREERRGQAAPRGPASEPQRDSRDRGGRSGGGGGYPSGPRADRGHYDDRSRYDDRGYASGGGERYGNGGYGRYNGGGGGGGRGGRGGGYPQNGNNYRS